MRAQRKNKSREWIQERIPSHGPAFKTSIMGSPTVVITGRAGNRFFFSASDVVLSVKQPASIVRLCGEHNIFELTGSRYKLVKNALMSFLKQLETSGVHRIHDGLIKAAQLFSNTKGQDIYSPDCATHTGALHDCETDLIYTAEKKGEAYRGNCNT
ncbi:taxadiene 5-alpha hydroxylase-like [Typha angustifolia]|uniref:taxadiene 5-alpha hydroxylase-like n=1 Tax=Typha angustifolia TaxID=59011 RepID=UPI003C2AFD83